MSLGQLCGPAQGAAGWILLLCHYPWVLRGSSIKRILKAFNALQGVYPLPKYQLKRQAVQHDFITHIWSGGETQTMKAPRPPLGFLQRGLYESSPGAFLHLHSRESRKTLLGVSLPWRERYQGTRNSETLSDWKSPARC